MSNYKLRPHHGLCMIFFEGKGYNEEFIKNMQDVISMFNNFPDTQITLSISNDIICKACPNLGTNCFDPAISQLDNTILKKCNLKRGTTIKFCNYQKLIYKNIISLGTLKGICPECKWKNICERKIQQHNIKSE